MSPRNVTRDMRNREMKRDFILDAALQIIALHGIDSTSMKDIAVASGVSVGNLYTYFESKEVLFGDLLQRGQSRYGAIISKVAATEMGAREKLYYISEGWIHTEYNWAFTIMLQSIRLQKGISEELKGVATQRFTNNLEPMAQIMRQGQEQGVIMTGDVYQLALYFVSLIQGLTLQLAPGHIVPVTIEASNIVKLFMTPVAEEESEHFFESLRPNHFEFKKMFDNL